MVDNDSDSAKNEFYQRYNSFLLKVCRKACAGFDSQNELAEDIFQNAMIKGIKNIKSVHENASGERTNLEGQIKKWLSIIARNEFIDYLRKNKDEKFLAIPERAKNNEIEIEFDLGEPTQDPIENSQYGYLDPEKILSVLSDRERYILITYFSYYDPQSPDKHLPDKEIKRLCIMYGISSDNLRKIKSRALKKLRTANSQLIEKFS